MSISHFTRRLATAGVVTAVAAGTLVAGSTTAADAAVTGSGTYDCATPIGPLSVPFSLGSESLPEVVGTGLPVPGGLVPVTGLATLPASLLGTLSFLGLTDVGGSISNFSVLMGETPIPIDGLTTASLPIPGTGDLALPSNGTIGAFTTPLPGVYDLKLPSTFTFTPLLATPLGGFECVLDPASNPVIGSLTVIKQTSAISGAVKKAGKKFTATASVVRQIGLPGAGKVTAKLGSKTIGTKSLNDAGTAKFALPRSAAGKKVTLVYGGDPVTSGSKVKLPVR